MRSAGLLLPPAAVDSWHRGWALWNGQPSLLGIYGGCGGSGLEALNFSSLYLPSLHGQLRRRCFGTLSPQEASPSTTEAQVGSAAGQPIRQKMGPAFSGVAPTARRGGKPWPNHFCKHLLSRIVISTALLPRIVCTTVKLSQYCPPFATIFQDLHFWQHLSATIAVVTALRKALH